MQSVVTRVYSSKAVIHEDPHMERIHVRRSIVVLISASIFIAGFVVATTPPHTVATGYGGIPVLQSPGILNVNDLHPVHEALVPVEGVRTLTEIKVGHFPSGVVYNPVNRMIYVSDFGSNNVSIINTTTNSVAFTIPLSYGADLLTSDTSTGNVYVGSAFSTIYVISGRTNQVVHSVNIGSSGLISEPQVYDNEAGSVFATSAISNTVIALNGGSNDVTSVTKVGNNQCPNGAVFDPLNGDVYVSEECSKNLTVIDGGTGQVVATIPSVPPGQGLTYDPASNSVYVAANTGRPNATVVTVINATTNTVNTYIPLFHAYWGATYDPINGDVYVTGSSSDNVTIINASLNQVVANVPTPNVNYYYGRNGPLGIAYDPSNQHMYVSDSGADNVIVLPQFYPLTVQEIGLPTAIAWSFSFNGTSETSNRSTVSAVEPNGTYSLRANPVPGYATSLAVKDVNVSGHATTVTITFVRPNEGSSTATDIRNLLASDWYYLVAIGIVAGAAAYVVVHRRRSRPIFRTLVRQATTRA